MELDIFKNLIRIRFLQIGREITKKKELQSTRTSGNRQGLVCQSHRTGEHMPGPIDIKSF